MVKRLFIFAGFDKDQIADPTLVYYLNALSELGDIVFNMDNDLSATELSKITKIPNVLYASATRHCEYDFGSYKRGYVWARDNDILDKYDWVYLVNDSVLGPLFNLETILKDLESRGVDFIGMTTGYDRDVPVHIQSWFMGLSKKIFISEFFDNFITNIQRQAKKMDVVFKYELGLSNLILKRGYKYAVVFERGGGIVYTEPYKGLLNNVPFIKKLGLLNLGGIDLLYSYCSDELVQHIIDYIKRCKIVIHTENSVYKKICRLTLFGLPVFSIFKHNRSYKIYIFDFIPFCKFALQK